MEEKKTKFSLTDGLIIAILTVLGYACGYYYEEGYIDYFHIPSEYVELSNAIIIKSVGIVFAIVVIILITGNILHEGILKFYRKNILLRNLINRISVTIGFCLFFILLFRFNVYTVIAMMLFLIVSLILDSLSFRRQWKYVTEQVTMFSALAVNGEKEKILEYKEKLNEDLKVRQKEHEDYKKNSGFLLSFFLTASNENRVKFICLLYILLAVPNVSYIGMHNAAIEKKFLVIRGSTDMVVIGNYKDYSIAANVNLKKRELTPKYKLVKNENLEAELIDLGPLKIKKPLTVTEATYK